MHRVLLFAFEHYVQCLLCLLCTVDYDGKRDAIVKNERKKMDDGKKRDLLKRKMVRKTS